MSPSTKTGRQHQKSASLNRASIAAQKTEVLIHVYDLLPPGRLSNILWAFGGALLHSGVVINGKEYAYGGHDRKGMSGVYWTRPKLEPPGGTFRCHVLQGFTFHTEQEIADIISETSNKFQGTSYNLLSNNCNHFTSYLCHQLTSKPAPSWLNRAASIGLAFPCVVPREWVSPPDHETADGELVAESAPDQPQDQAEYSTEDDDDEQDRYENSSMLASDQRRQRREDFRRTSQKTPPSQGPARLKDTSGRVLPASDRAPLPNK